MSSSRSIASLASSCSVCLRHEARPRLLPSRSLSFSPRQPYPSFCLPTSRTSSTSTTTTTTTPTAISQTSSQPQSQQKQQRSFTSDSTMRQDATLLKAKPGLAPKRLGPEHGYRENKLNRPKVGRTRVQKPYAVNTSIDTLNEAFVKLLGEGGEKAIPDDLKWQCVTHKSFDHGMQPFNEKLAFFGRRITYLHTTLALLNASPDDRREVPELERDLAAGLRSITTAPFEHAQYRNLDGISYTTIDDVVKSANMVAIAKVTGIMACLRWKPRDADQLDDSGEEDVAKQAIFAVVGAIGLHRGAEAAKRVVLDRILASVKRLR